MPSPPLSGWQKFPADPKGDHAVPSWSLPWIYDQMCSETLLSYARVVKLSALVSALSSCQGSSASVLLRARKVPGTGLGKEIDVSVWEKDAARDGLGMPMLLCPAENQQLLADSEPHACMPL